MFYGAMVSLGALGVVTKVTLDIQRRFMMKQYVYQDFPLVALREHFDAIKSAGYINEVWWLKVLPVLERELRAVNIRPHWGKLFTIALAEIRDKYDRLLELTKMCEKFDPHDKFRNPFLNTDVFAI